MRIYWIDITLKDRSRKRHRLGGVTLAEAERRNAELKIESDKGILDSPIKEGLWRDIRIKFIRYLESEGRTNQYIKDSALYLRKMALFWGDNKPISTINRSIVQDFRTSLRDSGTTEASCNRHLAAGKAAFRVYDPDLPNPFKIRFYNENERIINTTHFLQDDERLRLLNAAKTISDDLWEILIVAMYSGWRKSEILNLRRDMVDMDRGYASVSQKRSRLIHRPISRKVIDVLCNIKDNGTPYFWINKATDRPYNRDWKFQWQKAKRIAGISSSFRFHDLRHDFAIRAYDITGSQRTVQDLLGHHQLSTTQRYVKVLPEKLRDTLDSL